MAYRYFATPKRKFIIADAPGHEQYTRNMVTGASKSDVAVVLIDVTKLDFTQERVALLPQTKRHTALAKPAAFTSTSWWPSTRWTPSASTRQVRARRPHSVNSQLAWIASFTAIPLSALEGDGVVAHTERTAWFQDRPCCHTESLALVEGHAGSHAHIAVQWVTRDDNDDHVRWVTGDVAEAAIAAGDEIRVFPSGASAVVAAIRTGRGTVQQAQPGEAVAVRFDRQVDVARGDWIVVGSAAETSAPASALRQRSHGWTLHRFTVGRRYVVRHGSRWLPARVTAISSCLDLQAGEWRDVGTTNAEDDWAAEPAPAPP